MTSSKLGGIPTIPLTPEVLAEIVRIGFDRHPSEACGVLLPTPRSRTPQSQVVEVPNRSMLHYESYKIEPRDVLAEIESWQRTASAEEVHQIVVWHTHPNGSVGPSKGDLQNRIANVSYLVVALTSDGRGIPTWF